MAASVVLDQLPKDAHQALETAGDLEHAKGTTTSPSTASSSTISLPQELVDLATDESFKVLIRLHPLPGAPTLRSLRFKLSSNQRFEMFINLMRRKLKLEEHESVFCYVNSMFAPGLDEGIGNLWRVSGFGRMAEGLGIGVLRTRADMGYAVL